MDEAMKTECETSARFEEKLSALETQVCTLTNAKEYPKEVTDIGLQLMAMRLQLAILKQLEQLNRDSLLNRAFQADTLKPGLEMIDTNLRRIRADVETLRILETR